MIRILWSPSHILKYSLPLVSFLRSVVCRVGFPHVVYLKSCISGRESRTFLKTTDLMDQNRAPESILRLQKRSRKFLSQSEARAAMWVFLTPSPNKGPKEPHIVHMGTMWHLCCRIRQGGNLGFPISPKITILVEDAEFLLPVKFLWVAFSGFREKSKM